VGYNSSKPEALTPHILLIPTAWKTPHLMFHAPYVTNWQLGVAMPRQHGDNTAPFILLEGAWAFLIVRSERIDPNQFGWSQAHDIE
jgi:hypothetical protein